MTKTDTSLADILLSERNKTMAYRLYTEYVKEGSTDFNDLEYHILNTARKYSLIFNENTDKFIVAYKVEYHELDSISWAQGHYFDDVIVATNYYRKKTTDIYQFLLTWEQLGDHTLDVILETMEEARAEGNIPACTLEGMLDLTIAFIRENPDIFDEDVVESLESIFKD